MRTSDKGILEIAENEGIVPAPYLDSVDVWTWGVGHTFAAGGLDPSTMDRSMPKDIDAAIDRAIDVFRLDLRRFEVRVDKAIKVPLEQHEFDALVSFDYNTGGIYKAQLTKAINRGDKDAARHFMGWVKPPEIRKRRMAEQRLFKTGDYDHNGDAIPIWQTDGNGNLSGVLRVMHGGEMLNRLRPYSGVKPPEAGGFDLGKFFAALVALFKGKKA